MAVSELKIKEFLVDGDGYGDGNGDGNGNGFGFGYGYGYGIKSINKNTVYRIDGIGTIITQIKRNIAKGFIVGKGAELKPCYIAKGQGYFAHGETMQEAVQSLQDKLLENLDTEETIANFKEEFEKGKKYPVRKFYEWHHYLTGSCEMGRKEFARLHNINIDKDEMTVEEFITLTENAYGGEIIKELEESYE